MDAVAAVAQADRGRPAKHAEVQDPDIRPHTTTGWRDRLLQEASAWKEEGLPRADGACVRAVAPRVQASQRKERWPQPRGGALVAHRATWGRHVQIPPLQSPRDTSLEELGRLAHQRRAIEQNYQQLKEAAAGACRDAAPPRP